ncbi:nuclear envelope integral membrane protein 2 [Bombina bombina]|uniref:nuclear envelope integral membrane protein 2 n=1 Tax=Bombina bombina TaxID=8345 RepID=UPI00235A64CE|nr:nuclear envelope integral membrane protein 2 [Bombina bombina]
MNCQYAENLQVSIICFLQSIWSSSDSNEAYINVNWYDERLRFDVKIINKPSVYTVSIKRTEFSTRHFILFFVGILLFCLASSLSRSAVLYYTAGVTLGVCASLVFILLIGKRFITQTKTFWLLMSGCWVFTAFTVKFLKDNISWLWSQNKSYLVGYFVAAVLLSFAACYKHGPIRSQWSINLITWTLQLIACFFIYFGLAVPDVAYAIIIILISAKGLCYPVRALSYLFRKLRAYFYHKKLVVRFLTEEEYREQADTETCMALENLRAYCRSPEFNSWLTVSRLSSPKRFADFILGSNHVSLEETNVHEEEYGFGSFFLEEQLFAQDRAAEPNQQVDLIQVDNEDVDDYQASNHSNYSLDHSFISNENSF